MKTEKKLLRMAKRYGKFFDSIPWDLTLDNLHLELLRSLYHYTKALKSCHNLSAKLHFTKAMNEVFDSMKEIH